MSLSAFDSSYILVVNKYILLLHEAVQSYLAHLKVESDNVHRNSVYRYNWMYLTYIYILAYLAYMNPSKYRAF